MPFNIKSATSLKFHKIKELCKEGGVVVLWSPHQICVMEVCSLYLPFPFFFIQVTIYYSNGFAKWQTLWALEKERSCKNRCGFRGWSERWKRGNIQDGICNEDKWLKLKRNVLLNSATLLIYIMDYAILSETSNNMIMLYTNFVTTTKTMSGKRKKKSTWCTTLKIVMQITVMQLFSEAFLNYFKFISKIAKF